MNGRDLTRDELMAIIVAVDQRKRGLRELLECKYMGEHAAQELEALESAAEIISKTHTEGGRIKCQW